MFSNAPQEDAPTVFGRVWSFASCEYDDSCLELRVGGALVDLELKPLEVLLQLLIHAGEVVSKERLLDSVWPGLMVVDGSLATAVSKLRKALGDADSSIVLTVPRVGYRLGVPVRIRPAVDSAAEISLRFSAGDPVPGREHWRMVRALPTPESREVWLAENPKTHELRVFKFALGAGRLRSLKREVTVSRFLRQSLGERPDFGRLLEWNFDTEPYLLEIEYGGPNLVEWAESQGGLSKIPLDTRLRLLANVASAVADAHQAGVVHKDLKPANILVASAANGSGQIKVVDFGSASLSAPERLQALGITNLGLTQTAEPRTSSLTGTLLYLAPEVLSGQPSKAPADVYALGVILYQIVVGDFRKQLSPGWEAEVEDPLLREDIAQAACGDPRKRLSSAAEFAARLRDLDRRRAELRRLEQEKVRDELARQRKAEARVRRPWMALAAAMLILVMAAAGVVYKSSIRISPPTPKARTVAVLPFRNATGDPSLDYLSIALANQIAGPLEYARNVSVRPVETTSKFNTGDVDVQRVGRELRVAYAISGRFLKSGDQLQLTMEMIDVEGSRLVWRETFNVPVRNTLAMQAQVAARTLRGMVSLLGGMEDFAGFSNLIKDSATQPKSQEAYDLFLRSLALPRDLGPTRQARTMLEQSVALDPGYAPAWAALAVRCQTQNWYSDGGTEAARCADRALDRAAALDPANVGIVVSRAMVHFHPHEIARSYQDVRDLVRRRPDSARAHFVLGYILRYAGLLEESERECDAALTVDAQDAGVRSCGVAFLLHGDYGRAQDYFRLDLGSEWEKALSMDLLLREGKTREAWDARPPTVPQWGGYGVLLAHLQHRPASEIAELVRMVKPNEDAEVNYFSAAHLAYAGQIDAAVTLLEAAIEGGYCSYPAMDTDPLLANLRARPEFAEIHSRAVACNRRFLSETRQKY